MSENNINKIRDAFAALNYHIIGYDHNDAQREKLEPFFYPKKKKNGLPPEAGEYLNHIKSKYAIASQRKYKQLGSWIADTFFGIVADGMTIEEMTEEFQIFNDQWTGMFNKKFFPKNTVKLFDGSQYSLYCTFGLIFNNGIDGDLLENVRKLHKKVKKSKFNRAYVIDMANRRVLKHGGLPNTLSPKPAKIEPLIFQ